MLFIVWKFYQKAFRKVKKIGPKGRSAEAEHISLSELTEDANQGHARVVRERGVLCPLSASAFQPKHLDFAKSFLVKFPHYEYFASTFRPPY